MEVKEFGFSVLHYNNRDYGYVQGIKFGMVEVRESDKNIDVFFDNKDIFTNLMSNYINENYSNYDVKFSNKNEMVVVNMEKPLAIQIIESGERVRRTAIDYINRHEYFNKNELMGIDIPYLDRSTYLTREVKSVVDFEGDICLLLDDKKRIRIEKVDIDTLVYIVSTLNRIETLI